MSQTAYILAGVSYYIVSIIIIVIVLNLINRKEKKKYQDEIVSLERDKNLIISSSILSELNKVEALVNNEKMEETYEDWQKRFKEIKDQEVPKITDALIEIEDCFNEKDYKTLSDKIAKAELEIFYVKTKANFLLDEIKEITLSEERNRETITKLKAKYREIITKYNKNKNDYKEVCAPLELQFENVDKLFAAFEVAMDANSYEEVGKIVKGIDDLIGNLGVVIDEAPTIILMGKNLIPNKMKDVKAISERMIAEGYNLDYLNLDYNIEESEKKIQNVFAKLNVLNVEDSIFELKTILGYFDGIYNDFDKEKQARKIFNEYIRKILVKANKLEKINNGLYRKLDIIKYSYDLTDDDVKIIEVIKQELVAIKKDYNEIVDAHRNKSFAYTRLGKEMERLNVRLSKTEEKLDGALKSLGSLEEDEQRAHEQLNEIKDILKKAKERIGSYKLPVIPNNYYVQLSEANVAIKEMIKEMNKKPVSIKTLNIRVDTARDLVLKLYNTSNEIVKTAAMAEVAIVYGNRYRPVNRNLDIEITRAEDLFFKGEFKKALENTIRAINVIEPGVHEKLLESVKR
ncbi:MAG TPA: septation ring formation regulator EzrA [Candidatus Coprovivens excrementavium]|nr:septation ring formation regulator EzrA [Candidatus Coprovivens excrementavium]